jgi:ribosomal protein S18 acetylase RimI-like enzyme
MQIYPAELVDLNDCCQMNMSYTTDYVWQMRTGENGRAMEIHFDLARLPRPMRVEYPRLPDELFEHWQHKDCFLIGRNAPDDMVGFVDAQTWSWQSLLWICNLVIAPDYRRQGFGAKLLEAVVQWARERNLSRLMLDLQTKNYPAISFVQKHGFQFCGYNERYYSNGDIALFFSRPS